MRFAGMTYMDYKERKSKVFDCKDAYGALEKANKKWNIESVEEDSNEETRLLVVESHKAEHAFFQFTSEEACLKFIARKQEIEWSSKETKVWNGDGKRMTDTY